MGRIQILHRIVLVLCLLNVGAASARAGMIGLDARHGYTSGSFVLHGSFEAFRDTFSQEGHVIVPLESFLSSDLQGLDGLVLHQPYTQNIDLGFSGAEIESIHRFVESGGGVLIHGDGGAGSDLRTPNLNLLSEPYGIVYAGMPSEANSHTIVEFHVHPITEGVSIVGFDYQRILQVIQSPAIDLTVLSGADDSIAVVDGTGGAGNVVFVSDGSGWTNEGSGSMTPITYGDNQLLLRNILRHISEPLCPPSSAGTVNAGVGSVQNVLFLNGLTGTDPERVVNYKVFETFELEVRRPPSVFGAERAPFAVYIWAGEPPTDVEPTPLPLGIGCTRLPIPMSGMQPQPDLVFNNAGRLTKLGIPSKPSSPAPSILARKQGGLRRPGTFYIQGIIFDPGSAASVPASVTNGILARPDF